MKPPFGRRLPGLLFLTLVAIPLGCGHPGSDAPAPGPAVVTVSQPVEKDVTDFSRFTGRTAAVESVEIRARVSGYLQSINYQAGQEVKQGQLLFQIDPVVYQAALEKAEADVAQYQ